MFYLKQEASITKEAEITFDAIFEQELKNNRVYSPAIVTTKFNYADNIYKRINKLAPRGAITDPIIGIKYVLLNSSIRAAIQTICSVKKASVVLYTRDAFIIEFDAHFYKCSISPLFKDTTIKIYSFDSGQTIHVPLKYPWCKLEEKLISIW